MRDGYDSAVAPPVKVVSQDVKDVKSATKSPAQGSDEPWRAMLKVGDAVSIYSSSGGGWLPGILTAASKERVKVEYVACGERCDKIVLRTSSDIGLPLGSMSETAQVPQAPEPHAAPSVARPKQNVPYAASEWLQASDLEVGELLGSGGFGAVFKGRYDGMDVAVKQLHLQTGAMPSKEQIEEFHKEVANLRSLRHPRLINFIGVAFDPPMVCIVTEIATGGSLFSVLHIQRLNITPAQRRQLVLQITEGVEYLHSQRPPCVHRDLKSANVVLDFGLTEPNGQTLPCEFNAKLCDFGLTEPMEKTHISRKETEGGSPRYMAPEVFDARSKLTEKLDIWSLACLIVEILKGMEPHADCTSISQLATKLLVQKLPPFEDSSYEGVHSDVESLVKSCFVRKMADRPSAATLLSALGALPSLLCS